MGKWRFWIAAAVLGFGQVAWAQEPAAPTAAFTDSSPALLAGTRRVAITGVTVVFQASTGAVAGAQFFIPRLTAREKVMSVLAMPAMNQDLQDAIAEAAYVALIKDLMAAGYAIVPEAEVKASANYTAILRQAGYANHSRYGTLMGDAVLVSPAGLQPYMAYNGETGTFLSPMSSYLGWTSGFGGKSSTPGGPSIMLAAGAWKVPGLEVALARELNAHVVKATYVVSMGKTEARRHTDFSVSQHSGLFTYQGELYSGNYSTLDRTVTGTGQAFAQVGLVQDQTHIAFRSPDGNAKWQKVSMLGTAAPKDGDVVVRMSAPMLGSTDFFRVREGEIPRVGGLFTGQKREDINVGFIATIGDEPGYGREVTGMIVAANKAMLALIR